MAKKDDSLFLFEVLVDKVFFSKVPCFFDRDFKTCINIACPAIEPIEICDDDTSNFPEGKGPFLKVFNRGKSCLFSLKETEISTCISSFPVKVTIYKVLPCGCLPTKIIMGECSINMTKEFMESRQKFLSNPNDVSYQALKDSFRFVGPDGTETGEILMFLRISCFGNKIVTQFQGTPHATIPGDSGVIDRSCDPQKEFQSKEDPCACGAIRGLKSGKHSVCPPAEDKYNSMPCEEPEEPCFCSGPRSQNKQDLGCRNTFPYCLHVPKGPSKEYEEIGSNVNGNELKIKVPAGASIIKKISQTHCTLQRPYSKRKNDGPCDPPCGMNQISLALPSEAICCHGAQPAGTQFSCTTEGCLQAKSHAQSLSRGDSNRQEIPNKDVFVLKIAKTATEGERKCHTELELTTPKGPDNNEQTIKTNTAIQSDLDCECRVARLKRIKNKGKPKYCCPTGNKVVFQIPTGFCDVSHKQRAHFNFTSDGVGDVSRDDPEQLIPTNAENYPGMVRKEMNYFQYMAKNKKQAKTLCLLRLFEDTEKSTIDRELCLSKQFKHIHSNKRAQFDHSTGLYGKTICVYSMTSIEKDYTHYCTNGTQATALLNKCLQVHDCESEEPTIPHSKFYTNSTDLSTSVTVSKTLTPKVAEHLLNPQLYFWGKKKEIRKEKGKGMGRTGSTSSASSKSGNKLKLKDSKELNVKKSKELQFKESKTKARKGVENNVSKSTIKSAKSTSSDSKQQKLKKGKDLEENSKKRKKASLIYIKDENSLDTKAAASTSKKVSIDDKDVAVKDNVMVTISHIKIGPTDICPPHCRVPTVGLKCHVTPPKDEDQGRIKVTSTNNSRRGVFELVVRKLTGAPLATNELLLEWSPPPIPCKPSTPPAPAYLPITRCLPTKCKRVICRPCKPRPCFPPSPCASCNACIKPACTKPACTKPACTKPCRPPPCRPICRPPTIICSPVRYCPPPLSPCKLPCRPCKANGIPYSSPCKVGRRRPRKMKSQIKMISRRTYVSPCLNRSRTCPLIACRSAPSCVICCK